MDDETFHGKDRCQSGCEVEEGSVFGANREYCSMVCHSGLTSCLVGCDPNDSMNRVATPSSSKNELVEEIVLQGQTFREKRFQMNRSNDKCLQLRIDHSKTWVL